MPPDLVASGGASMSFAAETKKELTQIESKPCCQRAELSALVRMNGSMRFAGSRQTMDIQTENAAIARRIYTLVKRAYRIQAEVLIRKKAQLKKNNVYIVRIPISRGKEAAGSSSDQRDILLDLGLVRDSNNRLIIVSGIDPKIIRKNCCKRAFLRGAFLAGGSVNNPERNSYHLEISCFSESLCQQLSELANQFDVNAKCIERKNSYVLYMKEGEKITAFLNVIGAHQALLHFEDVRIVKDMRNSVNRLVNCETANLNKTIQASMKQVANIRLIEKVWGLENLPPKLREVAEARLAHPDLSLSELGQQLPGGAMSKSGVNHRLRKLDEIAARIRQKCPQDML